MEYIKEQETLIIDTLIIDLGIINVWLEALGGGYILH